jgi:hypothetical protein
LEKSVGVVNYETRTGGRIDIYMEDDQGRSISIENKIYAGDQTHQIERYRNFNTEKNKVVYLTLWGDDASEESRGELTAGMDYHLASYEHDILYWLEACQKEAVQYETLRSSIYQYICLIKKLTNQLSNKKMEKEIRTLIKSNYIAAVQIRSQLEDVDMEQAYEVFQEVKEVLIEKLGENWRVDISTFKDVWGGMTLSHPSFPEGVDIKIQGYPRHIWKHPGTIGVHANAKEVDFSMLSRRLGDLSFFETGKRSSDWYYAFRFFLGWDQDSERAKLFDPGERQNNVNYLVENIVSLAKEVQERFESNG